MDSLAELAEQVQQVRLSLPPFSLNQPVLFSQAAPDGSHVHTLCSRLLQESAGLESKSQNNSNFLRKASSSTERSPPPTLSREAKSLGSLPIRSDGESRDAELPIVDVKVMVRGEKIPEGYSKVLQLNEDTAADLAKPARNVYAAPIHLLIKRGSLRPVTHILIAFVGKGEHVPPGFDAITRTVSGQSADLSVCFQGPFTKTFLCVSRECGPPLIDIAFAKASKDLPGKYALVERSPLGYSTLLHSGKLSKGSFGIAVCRDVKLRQMPDVGSQKQLRLLAHGCYSSHAGTALVCLCSIERAVSSASILEEELEFLLGLTVESMRTGLDVVVHRAMNVIHAVVLREHSNSSVLLRIAQAVVYCKEFFAPVPSHVYSSIDDDSATSHTGSNGSPTRSSKGRSSIGSQSSDYEIDLETGSLDNAPLTLAHEDAEEAKQLPERIVSAIAQANPAPKALLSVGDDIRTYIRESILGDIINVCDGLCATTKAHSTLTHIPSMSATFATAAAKHCTQIFPPPDDRRALLMLFLAKLAAEQKSAAALDLLACHLSSSGDSHDAVYAYHVRLFAFDAILRCLPHMDLLEPLLALLSVLWKQYRFEVVLELGVVVEVVLVDALRNDATKEEVKRAVLESLQKWLGNHAVDLVQFYLNFENDPLVPTWRSFQNIISAICDIASKTSVLQPLALHTLVAVMRLLADASANVHLIAVDAGLRRESKWEWAACASPSVRRRHLSRDRSCKLIKAALEQSRVEKALKALAREGMVKQSAKASAEALHVYRVQLGEEGVGDYLGETGVTESDKTFHEDLRVAYTRLLPFNETSFEECLRTFLTRGGFRLPGEGQKIGAILSGFAKWYLEEYPGSFPTEDVAFMLAYSMVMLNTSLHNKCAKSCRFDKQSFYKMLCNIPDHNFTRNFSDEIFDSIQTREIKLPTATDGESGEDEEEEAWTVSCRHAFALVKAARSRRKAYFHREMSGDCVLLMLQVIWMHAFNVVSALLDTSIPPQSRQPNHELVCLALDLLRHCLSACLFLGLDTERVAFATLLAKLHFVQVEANETEEVEADCVVKDRPLDRRWVSAVLDEEGGDERDVISVIGEVHEVTTRLKEAVLRREQEEKLLAIQKRFHGSSEIVGHGKRSFIREGPLIKRCSRKDKRYQFFLFSDALVYASQKLTTQKYVVHRSLPLQTMRIVDTVKQPSRLFEICSPVKSILVQALTMEDKRQWIQHLTAAINALTGRKENLIMNKTNSLEDLQDDSDSEEELRQEEEFVLVQRETMTEHKVGAEILDMHGAALERAFVKALKCSKLILLNKHTGVQATDNEKLLLYAYFKQATAGDCTIDTPPPDRWIEAAKYNAWKAREGMDKQQAMRSFVSLLNATAPGWSQSDTR